MSTPQSIPDISDVIPFIKGIGTTYTGPGVEMMLGPEESKNSHWIVPSPTAPRAAGAFHHVLHRRLCTLECPAYSVGLGKYSPGTGRKTALEFPKAAWLI